MSEKFAKKVKGVYIFHFVEGSDFQPEELTVIVVFRAFPVF